MKAEAYLAFLKEKEMVDKVVEAITAEDDAERLARHKKEGEIRGYIEDFIREQEVCEHGSLHKLKGFGASLVYLYANHIHRQEVACKLDSLKVSGEGSSQVARQRCLANPRYIF